MLHGTNDTYCCLGVACDVYMQHNEDLIRELVGDPDDPPTAYNYTDLSHLDSSNAVLPQVVQEWLGLASNDGDYVYESDDPEFEHNTTSLVSENDSGATFDKIADII